MLRVQQIANRIAQRLVAEQRPLTPDRIVSDVTPVVYQPGFDVEAARSTFARFVEATVPFKLEPWQEFHICRRLQEMLGQTGQRLLMHGPPQMGKPCYNRCMILMHDGSRKRLEDIRVGDRVIAHTGIPRRVSAVHVQGDLECVEIVTRNGRRTIAALDHPFLTPEGWVQAGDLVSEQTLANISDPQCESSSERSDAEFELVGYFIGDGSVGKAGEGTIHAGITSNDPLQAERFVSLASSLGFGYRVFQKNNTTALTYAFRGGIRNWLREVGIAGSVSGTKRVPEWVFRGSSHQIALFLGAYFSCDGTISKKGLGRDGLARSGAAIEFYSICEELLYDVQHLLLRLGVQSRVSLKNGRYIGTKHTSYRLTIISQDYIAQFARRIPVAGVKGERLRGIRIYRKTFQPAILDDQILSVERIGLKPCRCLTVENDHTFTSDDLVVHNSILLSQRFPAWVLGHHPMDRFRLCCYNQSHAARFTEVNLEVMRQKDYQTVFPDDACRVPRICRADEWYTRGRKALLDSQPSMTALGLGSGFTGLGAEWVLIDDPYKNRQEAFSETINTTIWEWMRDVVLPRLNPLTNVIVLFHRWKDDDLAGKLSEQTNKAGEPIWEQIRFPDIADDGEHDPTGRAPGEPLSARYPVEYLEEIERAMGTSYLSLYRGKPVAGGGNKVKERDLLILPVLPRADEMQFVRYWDKAGTEGGGNRTAGVLMAHNYQTGMFYVVDVVYGQWGETNREKEILACAQRDTLRYGNVITWMEEEGGSAGSESAQHTIKRLAGYEVYSEKVSGHGDKEARFRPFCSQAGAGNVRLLAGEWNLDYIKELTRFPMAEYDDMVDGTSGAFNKLALEMDWTFG